MLVAISKIKINPGRRELVPKRVEELASSIAISSLLCPITLNQDYTLIAGLHRLEAVRLLGWTEIECNVIELNDLQAQIAEIDENIIRSNLNDIDLGRILLRRKEAYELLHPSTKQGGDRKSEEIKTRGARFDKPFTVDTSEKTGMSRRSVEEKMQVVHNLTPEVQEIVKDNNIGFKKALQLSHLPSDQQKDAVTMLLNGEIRSVDEYTASQTDTEPDAPPFHIGGKKFATFAEGVADLKNPDKDFSCTPDDFLAEVTAFVRKFHQEIEWYNNPYYEEVFPALSPEQLDYLRGQMDSASAAADELYNIVERTIKK